MMDDRLDKVRHLRRLTNILALRSPATNVPIEVDGGINDKTILRAKDAGATRFVATSHIWQSEDPSEQFKKLSEIIF